MPKKILFADDDAFVSRIYRDKLTQEGFEVLVTEDGVATLKQVAEFKPDLLVLDLLMPRLNGADVLKYIRQHPDLKALPVIIFSNSFLSALVEQVGALGVERAIAKSTATPALLVELINHILGGRSPGTNRREITGVPPTPTAAAIADFFPTPADENSDEQFRQEVQQKFTERLPKVVAEIRQFSHELLEAPNLASELKAVEDLSRAVGFLTQMGSMGECPVLAQFSSALELLLFHLHEKGKAIDDSCRNTIATAVAFLTQYLDKFDQDQAKSLPTASVLVVDDDLVINRGIVHALVHASVPAASAIEPNAALEKLRHTPYDLILLDISLPGMNGMDLCEKIRQLDLHRRTPVIFITGHTDAKIEARSILSGGNDFISKPILPIELVVKVITLLLKSRFEADRRRN